MDSNNRNYIYLFNNLHNAVKTSEFQNTSAILAIFFTVVLWFGVNMLNTNRVNERKRERWLTYVQTVVDSFCHRHEV